MGWCFSTVILSEPGDLDGLGTWRFPEAVKALILSTKGSDDILSVDANREVIKQMGNNKKKKNIK